MDKQYTRWTKSALIQAIEKRRVIVISGARQCGKTTISRQLAIHNSRSLDDVTLLKAAGGTNSHTNCCNVGIT